MEDKPVKSASSPKRFSRWALATAGIAIIGILTLVFMCTDCSSGKNSIENEKEIGREHKIGVLTDTLNGHRWVDLGLPSGLRWATTNVGAASAEEGGDYFAWGETEPKSEYSTINSSTYKISLKKLKKIGIIDENGILTPEHDAATANWGPGWRMPTDDEYRELIEICDWEFTNQNGENGYLVTGPNKKTIFFPAAAFQQNTTIENLGEFGDYWSSTIVKELTGVACSMGYSSKSYGRRRYARYAGRTIRPVTD